MPRYLLAAILAVTPAVAGAGDSRINGQHFDMGLSAFGACPSGPAWRSCPAGRAVVGVERKRHFRHGKGDGRHFVRVYPFYNGNGFDAGYDDGYQAGQRAAGAAETGPKVVDVTPKAVLRLGDPIDGNFVRVTAYNYGLDPSGRYYRRDGHVVRVNPDTLQIVELLGAMEPFL